MKSTLLIEGCLVEIRDDSYSFVNCHLYKNDERSPFYVNPLTFTIPPVPYNLKAGTVGILIKALTKTKNVRMRGARVDYLVLVEEVLYVVPDYGVRELNE